MTEQAIARAWRTPPPALHAEAQQPGGEGRRTTPLLAQHLGAKTFRARYRLRYAYLAGAMYKGVASADLVVRLGRQGLMGMLGTGGVALEKIEADIRQIQQQLGNDGRYGVNLLHALNDPAAEMRQVALYLRQGVRCLEAAAFMQVTKALVWYRASGIQWHADGAVENQHRIIAKVSRPEVAAEFLVPPPQPWLDELVREQKITARQAQLATTMPIASDLCVEADSGGHTDQGVASVIFPSIRRLAQELVELHGFTDFVHVGLAGGIGTPEAAAAAFILGADFIVTGSINQCTVEAATSDAVKDLLQDMAIQDTDLAPAGDMFEIGARVQVLKKGVFFPARANRLFELYARYACWEDIPEAVRRQLESRYFQLSFDEVFARVTAYYLRTNRGTVIDKANTDAKKKMALVFRWYFWLTTQLALAGAPNRQLDYQIHTGPALGAFNHWVQGTPLQSWHDRHVDDIAERLMQATAVYLGNWMQHLEL